MLVGAPWMASYCGYNVPRLIPVAVADADVVEVEVPEYDLRKDMERMYQDPNPNPHPNPNTNPTKRNPTIVDGHYRDNKMVVTDQDTKPNPNPAQRGRFRITI